MSALRRGILGLLLGLRLGLPAARAEPPVAPPVAPLAPVAPPRWTGPAAATVDGVAISRERLDRFVEEYAAAKGRSVGGIQSPAVYRRMVREALDQLVDDELIGQEAFRRGFRPSPAEVDALVSEARAAFGLPVQFELRLERSGFDEQGYREHVARQLAVSRLVAREVAPTVQVSDAQVHAWYLEHGAATGQTEEAAREVIRERLRGPLVEAAVRARLVTLRARATIVVLVPTEARP